MATGGRTQPIHLDLTIMNRHHYDALVSAMRRARAEIKDPDPLSPRYAEAAQHGLTPMEFLAWELFWLAWARGFMPENFVMEISEGDELLTIAIREAVFRAALESGEGEWLAA